MIIPSIDLRAGNAVQLVEGRTPKLNAGDPRPLLQRFQRVGEVAVIDLDAALGTGNNGAVIEELCAQAACRVGGGIRDYASALRWLDAGAAKIILGTAAEPELLKRLPKQRLQVALDARDGEVVVQGWTQGTGHALLERIAALRHYTDSFLVTFVEREGHLGGTDLALARAVIEAAGSARVTIAGGVTSAEEIATLDALGADAQVGMAIYSGQLGLAEAYCAPLQSDRQDGLWPTVVCDESQRALGLVYSNLESVTAALETGKGVYWSRKRGLWEKGASSGASQKLLRFEVDCDRDCLRAIVRQAGAGFCHQATRSCWGEARGLAALDSTLRQRQQDAPEGSYTARLFSDPQLLGSKLREEAEELATAISTQELVHEASDVLFFTLTRLRAAGLGLVEIEAELDRRALVQTRRGGDAKS